MPVLEVFDRDKKVVGSIDLKEEVFGVEYENKEVLVYEVARSQMVAMRSGTHAVKTYATVSGGNSKPFRQKGTGRARRGCMRASTLRGGVKAFGPSPRDYSISMPKKKKRNALKALLSERAANGRLFVVKEFSFDNVKTKEAARVLKDAWNLKDAVVVAGDAEEKFYLSMRNLPRFNFVHYEWINVFDLLNNNNVVITEEAAKHLNEVLG